MQGQALLFACSCAGGRIPLLELGLLRGLHLVHLLLLAHAIGLIDAHVLGETRSLALSLILSFLPSQDFLLLLPDGVSVRRLVIQSSVSDSIFGLLNLSVDVLDIDLGTLATRLSCIKSLLTSLLAVRRARS